MNHLMIAAQVVVFAASSLTNVLERAADQFRRETGIEVLVNAGASNSQARQILLGAPADLFCSADELQLEGVERAGHVLAGSRAVLAWNRLVIVVPAARARRFASPMALLDRTVQRIAVGDPAAVPVGVYTRRYLERQALWTALEPKLVPTLNVRAALAAVEGSNVDAAFVYASDARASTRVAVAFEVPRAEAPVVYPAAVLKRAPNPAGATRFLAFLTGARADRLWEEAGFIVPGTRDR